MTARSPHPVLTRASSSLAMLCGLALAACGAVEERPETELDCGVEADYELLPINFTFWFGFGDDTPGGLWRGRYPFTDEEVEAAREAQRATWPEGYPIETFPEACYTTPTEPTRLCPPGERSIDGPNGPEPCNFYRTQNELTDKQLTCTAANEDCETSHCGREGVWTFRTYGHHDWGSGFGSEVSPRPAHANEAITEEDDGIYGPPGAILYDGSGYEGVAFWARAPEGTTDGVKLIIDTSDTAKPATWGAESCPDPGAGRPAYDEHPFDCTEPEVVEGTIETIQADGTVISSSSTTRPSDCGNGFERSLNVSRDWTFYTLPWDSYHQNALPNRRPEGIRESEIYQFGLRAPREAVWNLQISGFSFYRRR